MPSLTERLALRSLHLRGWRSLRVPTSVGRVHVITARGGGSLPPMVVLHGLGAAGVNYVPLLRRLREHASEVVAIDSPGHGFSDVPRPGLSPDAMRVGLREALDQVAAERGSVVLFGNSMGGFAALRYAVEQPKLVRGVVLCSPGGAHMSHAELTELMRQFRIATHTDALDFVDRLLVSRTWMRHVIAWGVRRKFNEPHLRRLIDAIDAEHLLTADEIRGLEVPALVIWGRGERILPPQCLDFFREHLPDHVEWLEPDDFGHTPHLERPGKLTKHVVGFVSQL